MQFVLGLDHAVLQNLEPVEVVHVAHILIVFCLFFQFQLHDLHPIFRTQVPEFLESLGLRELVDTLHRLLMESETELVHADFLHSGHTEVVSQHKQLHPALVGHILRDGQDPEDYGVQQDLE